MRYIADSNGYVKEVSFGADIACDGQMCTEYTGAVPSGYTSLEEWFLEELDKLYRWKIVSGNLTLDSAAVAPVETPPMADYVVVQNYKNGWYYKKWNSGVAECWAHMYGSGNAVSGGNTMVIELPFYFSDTEYVVEITRSHNGSIVSTFGDYDGGGNRNHGYGYFYFRYILTSGYYPSFNFHVIGKWK
ncbi:MAG: hypothetical protein IKZ08_03075 [Bacteroidales bacterium]|nr:hypothetical protein [Bacteroidales bacterium]